MKSLSRIRILCLIFLLGGMIEAMPLEEQVAKRASAPPPIGETIQQLTNQLIEINATMPNTTITLDTRTPPRVKQQMLKNYQKVHAIVEDSHPGMAIPADESEFNIHLEESITTTTKKPNFPKNEPKTSTEQGISTWVLLNSQTVSPSTAKPTIKPIVRLTTRINEIRNISGFFPAVTESSYKPIKTFFKKRLTTSTTTRKPTTTTKMILPVTKVKFSVLQNNKNKTRATTTSSTTTTTTTTSNPIKSTVTISSSSVTTISPSSIASKVTRKTTPKVSTSTTALPLEAKITEIELPSNSTNSKKTNKKSSNKKKKNKNRRRRPGGSKNGNSTIISDKIGNEKPIGTQLYNYLSREIMPTVGVGLVGLVVTAGLASYFLYPFAPLRRSYELERKDVKGGYYYNDYSMGGIAEEDMIGRILAGMPENQSLDMLTSERDDYNYAKNKQTQNGSSRPQKQKTYRETIDAYVPQNSFLSEETKLDPQISSVSNNLYNNNNRFVVGGITKKILEVTPAVVPEHGPRSLKRRKRSDIHDENYKENEILISSNNQDVPDRGIDSVTTTTLKYKTTEEITKEKNTSLGQSSTESYFKDSLDFGQKKKEVFSFLKLMSEIREIKFNFVLQMLKSVSGAILRYIQSFQYTESTLN